MILNHSVKAPSLPLRCSPTVFSEGARLLTLRKSQDRGYADHGWLRSFHSFSFAGYHDPRFMGFGNLRVISEAALRRALALPPMRTATWRSSSVVLSGALAHRDSMGSTAVIPAGVCRS